MIRIRLSFHLQNCATIFGVYFHIFGVIIFSICKWIYCYSCCYISVLWCTLFNASVVAVIVIKNSNNCMISHFHDMRSLCVCVYMYVVLLDTIYVYLQALLANNTDISSSSCVYALLFIYEIYSIIINHARRLCKQ